MLHIYNTLDLNTPVTYFYHVLPPHYRFVIKSSHNIIQTKIGILSQQIRTRTASVRVLH